MFSRQAAGGCRAPEGGSAREHCSEQGADGGSQHPAGQRTQFGTERGRGLAGDGSHYPADERTLPGTRYGWLENTVRNKTQGGGEAAPQRILIFP